MKTPVLLWFLCAFALSSFAAEKFRVTCPYCSTRQVLAPLNVTTNSEMYWGTPPGTNYSLTLVMKCGNPSCLQLFPAHRQKIVNLVMAEEVPDIDDAIKIPPPLPQVPLRIIPIPSPKEMVPAIIQASKPKTPAEILPPTAIAPDLSILRVPPGHVLVTIPLASVSQEELLAILVTNKATANLVIVRPK